MPLALLALTISAFAIGTTEFVIVGLVPTIAHQLAISLPSAGLLVSIYALGVAVGAPVLTALTGRFRKQLLIALMVLLPLATFWPGRRRITRLWLLPGCSPASRMACSSPSVQPLQQAWCLKRKRRQPLRLCLVD